MAIIRMIAGWCGMLLLRFGGGGSSSSNTTTNVDKRQVVDAGGIGVSSDKSTVSVTNQSMDGGAVAGALDTVKATTKDVLEYAAKNDLAAGSSAAQVLNLAGQVISTGADLLDKQSAGLQQQGAALASAYQDAKGQTADNKYLIAGALAVVGVVAVSSLRKWG